MELALIYKSDTAIYNKLVKKDKKLAETKRFLNDDNIDFIETESFKLNKYDLDTMNHTFDGVTRGSVHDWFALHFNTLLLIKMYIIIIVYFS